MKENTNVELSFTLKKYFPLTSVVVPLLVPFITTLTPDKSSPFTSLTTPVTAKS